MKLPSFSVKDAEKIFFTSDTHFHHRNIIEYCHRPFQDEFYMDEAMIENWNRVVPQDGIVFHAGDFAMTANVKWIESVVQKLNGRIYLCLGNHDYQNRFDRQVIRDLFYQTDDMYYFTVEDEDLPTKHMNFHMCHYPLLYWRRGYHMLHGHVHSGPNSTAKEVVPHHFMRYDVGVDNNDFYPISYHQLKDFFTKNTTTDVETE